MSSDEAQQKVVDFSARRTAAPSVLPRRQLDLLRQVQQLAQRRLAAVSTALFQQVDDALFDLADRAGSSGAQQQYFDGMREIRRKRQRVEEWFAAQVDQAFQDYAAQRPLAAADAPAGSIGETEFTLTLVEDAELEESLALSSMAARAETQLSQTLHGLNRRLSALFGRDAADELTPMSPRVVCQAFVTAVRELDVTLQVRLILLKLFERHFVPAHQSACEEANRSLVDAGVMPQLRFKAPVRAPTPGVPRGGSQNASGLGGAPGGLPRELADAGFGGVGYAGGHGMHGEGDGGLTVELTHEIYSQLQDLLAARRNERTLGELDHGHSAAGGGMSSGAGGMPSSAYGASSMPAGAHEAPALSPQEILNALTLLQTESNKIGAAPPAIARDFKQALVAQAGRLAGSKRAERMQSQDEDAIDLVGMLFEFMIEDRQLPAQIQAMLARLQIPFLRAALLDRQLFTQKTHPARRLLDSLAEAGVGWSEQVDKDGRVITKIREVVETLMTDFQEDLTVFDRLSDDFTGFVATQRRRAELAEQRAAEAARGREKLEAARQSAGRVVSRALSRKGLPEVVREVLTGPWTKYLEIVHARRGGDSPEWRAATKLVDDLVWSVDPETVQTESKHWAAMLPSIDATLKQGLAAVGFHEADAHRVLAKLRQTYAGVLEAAKLGAAASVGGIVPTNRDGAANEDPKHDSQPSPEVMVDDVAVADAIVAASDPIDEPPSVPDATAPVAARENTMAQHLDTARKLKIGQWVEFEDDPSGIVRAKLSWVSAITQRYLFVNQNGLKVAEKTLHEVAADLKLGHMRVLEDNPLFDRALSAIVKRLRTA